MKLSNSETLQTLRVGFFFSQKRIKFVKKAKFINRQHSNQISEFQCATKCYNLLKCAVRCVTMSHKTTANCYRYELLQTAGKCYKLLCTLLPRHLIILLEFLLKLDYAKRRSTLCHCGRISKLTNFEAQNFKVAKFSLFDQWEDGLKKIIRITRGFLLYISIFQQTSGFTLGVLEISRSKKTAPWYENIYLSNSEFHF